MVKKRKVKVKSRRKTRVVRAPKAPAAREAMARAATPTQAEHVLGFVGGVIVVIAAIVMLIIAFNVEPLISLILGIIMVLLTAFIHQRPRVLAIFLLVLSLIALIVPPNGFIIGPILALIGAIIVLARR